jgi:hypothetical protein
LPVKPGGQAHVTPTVEEAPGCDGHTTPWTAAGFDKRGALEQLDDPDAHRAAFKALCSAKPPLVGG